MLNPDAKLAENIFSLEVEKRPTRDGFGTGTIEAARADPRVVVLCGDLAESTRALWFQKEFPERFIELGVAEQNMATVAAGMARAGMVPFIASYACFSPGRNYEQIRTTIALNHVPVKICGMHAGVSVGPDGATHQMLEDIGMMRMLPGMTVIAPGDAEEARKAVVAAAQTDGPVYLRFGREATPVFTTSETPFQIGKALTLWESENPTVAILATGAMSYTALEAARAFEASGIGSIVLHVPTIKPLDTEAILVAARRAGRVVTVEEHQTAGGFGSAVAELLSERHPVSVKRLGVRDQFGQSGAPEELLAYYGLDIAAIMHAASE
ncbi:transketolase [Candidatus Kaiserbacteria bacterium RIFCSPHIGHO2_02_FULL_55_17]|uniref:Transketolase n=1 Tax=Candidatus Kaiserbacteria bacterium RIFCSPHIGHO2_02_FULL_55_17 TaxID=1798496 RepID=A0A1F6DTF7_9BACT|nr:MAG: transketolase [Candidatus Kaiserbacteria bacterium RIFCSPHIGHO2_02_FULL_55_17]